MEGKYYQVKAHVQQKVVVYNSNLTLISQYQVKLSKYFIKSHKDWKTVNFCFRLTTENYICSAKDIKIIHSVISCLIACACTIRINTALIIARRSVHLTGFPV